MKVYRAGSSGHIGLCLSGRARRDGHWTLTGRPTKAPLYVWALRGEAGRADPFDSSSINILKKIVFMYIFIHYIVFEKKKKS
jgi:hypothetical protein